MFAEENYISAVKLAIASHRKGGKITSWSARKWGVRRDSGDCRKSGRFSIWATIKGGSPQQSRLQGGIHVMATADDTKLRVELDTTEDNSGVYYFSHGELT